MKRYIQRLAHCWGALFLALFGRDSGQPIENPGANAYFKPSRKMVLEAVPMLQVEMANIGYDRSGYLHVRKDCNIYSRRGAGILYDLLLEQTEGISDALNKELAVYQFSFRRENGARHRLIMVVDDEGKRWYIENFPVFDRYHDESGMIRFLSSGEERSGTIIG